PHTAINVETTAGGSNKRAFEIASFTLLACLLISGQALTAYFVLGQRNDIKAQEEQSNSLKKDLSLGLTDVPMSIMPVLIDESAEGVSLQLWKLHV
uniref:MHC class II-associated invariant chain/CLIP MHC II-interacting domain-containing protein n=1 Tax=Hucho hucho TaxID=62062 RepID=A0A4W5LFT9_9TELE